MSKRLLFSIGILITAAAGLWWYAGGPRPPRPPEMATADGADAAVVEAVEKARQQVLAAPKSAAAWGELGMVFKAHGFDPEAAVCFTEAQRIDPNDSRWPYLLGLIATVDNPERAIPLLRRAIELKPKDREAQFCARMLLAETLLDLHQTDDAAVIFREVLAESADNARARFGLAQAALTRGDRTAAREALAAVSDVPGARKRAEIILAAIAREDGDLAAAEKYQESVSRLPDDPPWPDPYMREVLAREVGLQGLLREANNLEQAGQLSQALEILEPLAQDNPSPRILVSAGIALSKLGFVTRDKAGKLERYKQAEAMFRECLRRDPGLSQAHYFLAFTLFEEAGGLGPDEKGKSQALLREAAASASKAVELKPDHGMAWVYLGRCRLALGETEAAIEALNQAVARRPEFTDPHLYLAEALAAAGRTAEATRSARVAVDLSRPDDPRARQFFDRLVKKSTQTPPKSP